MSYNQLDTYYKKYQKIVCDIDGSKREPEIFRDFLSIFVCSINTSNVMNTKPNDDNERLYFDIIDRYPKKSLNLFAKIMSLFMDFSNKNPYDDLLGYIFSQYTSKRNKHNQHFTPLSLSKLISGVTMGSDREIVGKTVCDPTCGSGALLLGAASLHPRNLYFGCDLDIYCCYMSVINLFINNMSGEICHGNSLSVDYYSVWRINWSSDSLGVIKIHPNNSFAFNTD